MAGGKAKIEALGELWCTPVFPLLYCLVCLS